MVIYASLAAILNYFCAYIYSRINEENVLMMLSPIKSRVLIYQVTYLIIYVVYWNNMYYLTFNAPQGSQGSSEVNVEVNSAIIGVALWGQESLKSLKIIISSAFAHAFLQQSLHGGHLGKTAAIVNPGIIENAPHLQNSSLYIQYTCVKFHNSIIKCTNFLHILWTIGNTEHQEATTQSSGNRYIP